MVAASLFRCLLQPDLGFMKSRVYRKDLGLKVCEVCGQQFGCKDNEKPWQFLARKHCSQACYIKTIAAKKEDNVCSECGSTETYIAKRAGRNPYVMWYYTKDGKPLCRNCRSRTMDNPGVIARKLRFRQRRVTLTFRPRTGECSQCHRTPRKTDMHHAKGYYIIFPWFGTVELCVRCHRRNHRGQKRDRKARFVV